MPMSRGPARHRLGTILTLIAVALAGSACSDDDDAGVEGTGVPVDDLEVVEVQELDLPFGDAYLSPDGGRIATYAEEELCVYGADGEQERCADGTVELDPNSVRWNPDGSRLVFTENFYQYFREPDVWTFDATSGELENLTDDGVDEGGLDMLTDPEEGEAAAADVDVSPEWADDGSTIRFLRWIHPDDTVEVMEMPADGGEPEQVGTLAADAAPGIIAYTPDGERAAYTRQEDVVMSGLDGENVETIADTPAYQLSTSFDGEEFLATPSGAMFNPPDAPAALAVSVDDGSATEIDQPVVWATWRTGGDGLAYARFDQEDPGQMTVNVSESSAAEPRELTTGWFTPPYRGASWLPPVWSARDTILLLQRSEAASSDLQHVLVHLGAE